MKACVVCKAEIAYGRTCPEPAECSAKFAAFLRPSPHNERVEKDAYRARFAQSDKAPTVDEPRTRSKAAP